MRSWPCAMPRGDNLRGRPGPGRRKGSKNRATVEVREAARRLVEDPAYFESLRARLVRGQAGAMEVAPWHFAFGKPRGADGQDDNDARLEAMRRAARERLASQDQVSLSVLEALYQGANLQDALRRVGMAAVSLTV